MLWLSMMPPPFPPMRDSLLAYRLPWHIDYRLCSIRQIRTHRRHSALIPTLPRCCGLRRHMYDRGPRLRLSSHPPGSRG